MRKNIRNHFAYLWWVYVVTGASIFAALFTIYDNLNQPKKSETLVLTYIGRGLDYVSLENKCSNSVKEFTSKTVKKLNVENPTIENAYQFDNIVRSRSSKGTDIFVFERSVLDEYKVDIPSYFAEVKEEAFARYFTSPITIDEKIYGSAVTKTSLLAHYYSNNSTLELYWNVNSENLQALYGKGEGDLGVEFATYLLGDSHV
ncbi:MAG: hypothetical protein K5694_02435 [Bacilli bacterium]|nr:hypothetical protein [Bacilli bacterium]